MATLTAYASAAGFIQSSHATYATARSGSSLVAYTSELTVESGQAISGGVYYCLETFLSFDTSSIPAGATITAVELSLDGYSDRGYQAFTNEVRVRDWGATLTTADYVAGADLSALTRVATLASSAYSAGYAACTEDGTNFRNAIVKGGMTRLLITSDRLAAGTTPTTFEMQDFTANPLAGGSPDPKLVVTYMFTHEAASALAGSATLAPLASGTFGAFASATAAATIAPTAGLTYAPGAALSAAATLAPLGTQDSLGAAALATSATLIADGNLGTLFGASALVGSATLAALAAPLVKNAAAALSASALLTARATRVGPIKTVSLGAGFTSSPRQHGGLPT